MASYKIAIVLKAAIVSIIKNVQYDNVKGVALSDEPTENYPLNMQLPIGFMERNSEFQLIV